MSEEKTRATDALIGDEEHGTLMKNKKERTVRNRERAPTQLRWIIRSYPTTRMDTTVSLFKQNNLIKK